MMKEKKTVCGLSRNFYTKKKYDRYDFIKIAFIS